MVLHHFTKVARCHDLLLGVGQIIPFEAWRALQLTDGELQHHAKLPPDQLEIDGVRQIEYRPNADGMQPAGCKVPPMEVVERVERELRPARRTQGADSGEQLTDGSTTSQRGQGYRAQPRAAK